MLLTELDQIFLVPVGLRAGLRKYVCGLVLVGGAGWRRLLAVAGARISVHLRLFGVAHGVHVGVALLVVVVVVLAVGAGDGVVRLCQDALDAELGRLHGGGCARGCAC